MADEVVSAVQEETPADRIRAAIRGKPPAGYVEVNAEDVLGVTDLVPPARMTAVTAALARGARAAPRRVNDDGEPVPTPVHPEAGKLAKLLEAAGALAE